MTFWDFRAEDDDSEPELRQDGGVASDTTDAEPEAVEQRLRERLDVATEQRDQARETVDKLEAELEAERREHEALESAVEALIDTVEANADGDLSATPPTAETDTAARLYDAYGGLLAEWRDIAQRMTSFSEQVSSATGQVDERLESVKTASREVDVAVDEISAGAAEQDYPTYSSGAQRRKSCGEHKRQSSPSRNHPNTDATIPSLTQLRVNHRSPRSRVRAQGSASPRPEPRHTTGISLTPRLIPEG
jgi:chromosome segregation ATPase